MPSIPIVTSRVNLDSSRDLDRSYSNVRASPNAFGAGAFGAVANLGDELANEQIKKASELQASKRAEDVANAAAQTPLEAVALQAQVDAPANGAGLVKSTYEQQKALIDKTAEERFANDPRAQSAYKASMYNKQAHYVTQATQNEFQKSAEASRNEIDKSLTGLANGLRVDPSSYDVALKQGNDAIDASTVIPNDKKEAYKKAWSQNAANTRFEGMLSAAKTVDDYDRIKAELTGRGADPVAKGMVEQGNIDLHKRPTVQNADGSVSTVRSISVGMDGKEVLIPTVSPDGKVLSNEDAIKLYRETGQHLGKFNTAADATAYAKDLHKQQEAQYANPWQKALSEKDFESLLTHIESGKKVVQTKADADARASVDSLEARNKDGVVLPVDELRATQALVRQSGNTLTQARLFRVTRDQDLLTQSRGLPPSELQARANAARGGAGVMYPNLPTEVARHISEATTAFPGVSASYLGGTVTREYGGNFPRRGSVGNVQFKPVPQRADVNLDNIQPAIRNGLTVAGQVLGEPLVVTSGYRDQKQQDNIRFRPGSDPNRPTVAKHSHHTEGDAVDISTVGKSPQQKAAMVDALVQSGFTGFGEYPTHIHADMRNTVPSNYGPGNGGWTSLTPEVQATLDRRGYKAGASAADINRAGPAQAILASGAQAPVDYTKGNAASTAKGLMQFTDGTWTDITDVKTSPEAVAAAKNVIGVDFAAMTPEQRLKYRDDPRVATLMGAAYAAKNKTALETTLQRNVSDAELYMAHVFGPGGATAFLRSYAANGDLPATQVLPTAADANKNLFYRKNGTPYTVRELYDNMTTSFLAQPSQVSYGDSVSWQRMHDNATKQLKDNPVGYARAQGTQTILPLDQEGGWEARGSTYSNIGKFFQIANEDNKPFDSATETAQLLRQMKDGSSEQVVSLLQDMAKMDNTGPGSFAAGMAQLGMKNTSYDVAGQLASSDAPSATMIVSGEKRMTADPSTKALLGDNNEARDAFTRVVGSSLSGIGPEVRDAIRKAANAYYVEAASTQGVDKFDKGLYERSLQTVIGGKEGPRLASVNSAPTVLPKGVTADKMEKAVDNLDATDLLRLSVTKDGRPSNAPPMYTDGTPVPPSDISYQGKFKYVGNDMYNIQMADGKYLTTGQRTYGGFALYYMRMEKDAVEQLANKPRSASPSRAVYGRSRAGSVGFSQTD